MMSDTVKSEDPVKYGGNVAMEAQELVDNCANNRKGGGLNGNLG